MLNNTIQNRESLTDKKMEGISRLLKSVERRRKIHEISNTLWFKYENLHKFKVADIVIFLKLSLKGDRHMI